jgi:hypothetical protein
MQTRTPYTATSTWAAPARERRVNEFEDWMKCLSKINGRDELGGGGIIKMTKLTKTGVIPRFLDKIILKIIAS